MKWVVFTAVALCFLTTDVRANYIYDVLFDAPTYSGSTGNSFTANLLLRETVSAPDGSEFATRTLNGAKFRVSVGNSSIAQITSFTPSGNLANGGFVDVGPGGGFLEFNSASFPSAGPTSTSVGASTRQYVVGTVGLNYVSAGLTSLDISTLNIRTSTSAPTSPTDFLIASPTVAVDMDNFAAGRSGGFTSSSITAVPEPSSLALLTLTACGLVLRRKRNS